LQVNRERSGDGRSIAARGYAQVADEGTGHVALVRKTGLYGCLGGCLTIRQKLSRKAHAPLNKVGVRRYSYFAREAPQELEAAHAR
jgi:hypothetical protein